jgi:hypothetical protein
MDRSSLYLLYSASKIFGCEILKSSVQLHQSILAIVLYSLAFTFVSAYSRQAEDVRFHNDHGTDVVLFLKRTWVVRRDENGSDTDGYH